MKKFFGFAFLVIIFFATAQIAFSKTIDVDGKIYTKSDIGKLEGYIKKNISIIPNVIPSYSKKYNPDIEYIKRLEIYKITILKIKENITLAQENADLKNELKTLTKKNITLAQENLNLKNNLGILNNKNKDLGDQVQKLRSQLLKTKEKTNNSANNVIIYVLCFLIALVIIAFIIAIHIILKDSKNAIQEEMDRYYEVDEFNKTLTEKSIGDVVKIKHLESEERKLKEELDSQKTLVNTLNEKNYQLKTENANLKQITDALTYVEQEAEESISKNQLEKQDDRSNGKPKVIEINRNQKS